MVRRVQLTESDARVHPNRSVITRALGTDANMVADAYDIDASAGDRLLLCSDGLTGMLEDARIGEILGAYRDPNVAASALLDAANESGGHDNISVVIIDIDTTSAGASGTREGDRKVRGVVSVLLWLLAFVFVVAAISYGTYLYAQRRAFLTAENGVVVVYRGVPGEIAGFSLKWRLVDTDVPAASLSPSIQQRLAEGERVNSVEEAVNLAASYRAMSGAEPSVTPTATPTP